MVPLRFVHCQFDCLIHPLSGNKFQQGPTGASRELLQRGLKRLRTVPIQTNSPFATTLFRYSKSFAMPAVQTPAGDFDRSMLIVALESAQIRFAGIVIPHTTRHLPKNLRTRYFKRVSSN